MRLLHALRFIPLTAFAVPLLAQTSTRDALAKHWKVSEEFTEAVAKAMPADGYSFRPTPEEMSFGQLVVHMGGGNLYCTAVSGMKRPDIPADIASAMKDHNATVEKESALKFLATTFQICEQAVSGLTSDKMDAVPSGKKTTSFELLLQAFTHVAHHRGQAEVYLRLKGIKPPEYQF